jgi:transcriptional regulator with XRE-family HTH domain
MTKKARSPADLRNMFGANLRVLSQDYPSISDLARKLGINRTQFNRYLSGESFPRPDVLDRICTFFKVDARILLEPVDCLSPTADALTSPFLADYVGQGLHQVTEDVFPSGFYRFSRKSFLDEDVFVLGLLFVFRRNGATFVRGYESREAMRAQGLPNDSRAREYRGLALREESGVTMLISRKGTMTCSFNFLSRVASFNNNFWVGYSTRTIPETLSSSRALRLVYEHIPNEWSQVMAAAREVGFARREELHPFHLRLLSPDHPFR